MKRISHIFFALVIAGSALAVAGCGGKKKEEQEKQEAAKEARDSVKLAAFYLQKGTISGEFQVPGDLQAYQKVELYAKINSFVKKLYVDVGSEVKTGQLLATLEAPEINSQLSAAESKLKAQEAVFIASKANYNRLLSTSKTPGTISPNDLDMALSKQNSDQAQLEAARAAYREVQSNQNYLEIRAPFNGVITLRNINPGAYVGPAGKGSEMPMFVLEEQKKLRLVVSVPEAQAPYLTQKSEVKFSVSALPGDSFRAKVTRLAGALDDRLRAQRTEMDVENSNKRLLPGMVAEVSLPLTGSRDAFLVPVSAVLNSTKGVYVIQVKDNKTVWIPVTTGTSGKGKTEVFGNLTENDVIVTKATEEVRDDAPAGKVEIRNTEW